MYGKHDGIGYFFYKTQKCVSLENEPGRNKTYKDEQNQNAEQPVKEKADKDLWITRHNAGRQAVDYKKSVVDDARAEICQDKGDKHRDQRCKARIDPEIRQEPRGGINEPLSDLFNLKAEPADLAERIRVGIIEGQTQDQGA